jgi:predicted Zn finger-like uncharacterized protein
MILNCNSCNKKFVVPDRAITPTGRLVQCGSCGNKWKQFPINTEENKIVPKKIIENKKISKNLIRKKKKPKKNREISLYSPEYLAKKHGIIIDKQKNVNNYNSNEKVSFGFYNSLILFIVVSVAFYKGLYFFQDIIVQKLPISEYYLNYFFESIKNILEILKNLISNY